MNEKTRREDASLAGINQSVGGPVEKAGRFTGASRRDAEPLKQGGSLGGEPTVGGSARE